MDPPLSLRAWYRRNGKWMIVMVVVSLIGAAIVLLLRALYEYQPTYYEPKDISREQQIEQKERGQQ
jgi:cytochrome c-type biogenesis protein CcmE